MSWDTAELTEQLAFEVSTDAAYLRGEKERLYFSGLEIASMFALGVLGSFLAGVVESARKAIVKKGDQVGTLAIDALAAKIETIGKRLTSARNMNKQDASDLVDDAKVQLERVATDPVLEMDLARQIDKPDEHVMISVSRYLQVVGYSTHDANDRATVLVERITIVARK